MEPRLNTSEFNPPQQVEGNDRGLLLKPLWVGLFCGKGGPVPGLTEFIKWHSPLMDFYLREDMLFLYIILFSIFPEILIFNFISSKF